jgi:hypothetical protein
MWRVNSHPMTDQFYLPDGAICDVPNCGEPATDAFPAGSPQGPGHVYLCRPHWEAITQNRMIPPNTPRHAGPWRKATDS